MNDVTPHEQAGIDAADAALRKAPFDIRAAVLVGIRAAEKAKPVPPVESVQLQAAERLLEVFRGLPPEATAADLLDALKTPAP